MPDRIVAPLRGVALLTGEGLSGLRVTCGRIAEGDLPRIRDAVDRAREAALASEPGTWEDVLIVWSRPGRKPLPEQLTGGAGAVEEIRKLLLELDR